MNKRIRISAFLWLIFCSAWVVAEERLFQVEVIVFDQSAPTTELFEQTEPEIISSARYARVKRGTKTINSYYRQLDRASNYRPFFYESFQVSVKSNRISLPIKISLPSENLEGWVKIQRGQLLHVITDLEYSPADSLESEGMVYRISEKRRVLLNESHFLDHPFFGVLLKVSPVEATQ